MPVLLSLALIAVLLLDTTRRVVSVQVIEPYASGQTFAFAQAPFGGDAVARLDMRAQGMAGSEVDTVLSDAEERRRYYGRHRIELMWRTQDGPLRWVVTHQRDGRVTDVDLIAGLLRWSELREGLADGQVLAVNPWLDAGFFERNASRAPVIAGLRTALVGTLWVTGLVILLAVPLGVGTALYLEEYARRGRWSRFLEVNIRNLAGVPSIIYGILGLYVFVRLMNLGPTILAAALTLSLLILPVVVIASREAIRAVPSSLREASYGLGATRWQTVSRVVLPRAVPGIVTGFILAIARAIGETAPLLLVGAAAFVPYLPDGLLSTYTVVPVQIYSWVSEAKPEFYRLASAAILTLLGFLGLLYAVANWVRRWSEAGR
ncbi:MAG: phosphate ABC transporter permease PstA [Trueperaceae bacterium]|nr:phosphate ABC transporter permease PstA [Trueperaceae bacterium]